MSTAACPFYSSINSSTVVKEMKITSFRVHNVKKFENTGEDLEDLISSIGTIGLIKAIESFSPNKGTKLATFAARCIENEVSKSLSNVKYFHYAKRHIRPIPCDIGSRTNGIQSQGGV